jgi:hypothetical protein
MLRSIVLTMQAEPQNFITKPLLDRAVVLLKESFRSPEESVSQVNVARGLANALDGGSRGILGARPMTDPTVEQVLDSVSEAWQVLEQARCICPDLTQNQGNWWKLTAKGRFIRDCSDPHGEIQLALGATP